jgi:hypothetical protein
MQKYPNTNGLLKPRPVENYGVTLAVFRRAGPLTGADERLSAIPLTCHRAVEKLCTVCGRWDLSLQNILLLIAFRLGKIPARLFDLISTRQKCSSAI